MPLFASSLTNPSSTITSKLAQEIDLFDAPFFRMSRAEATALDPQTRLLLQVSQEAFANAGAVG